MFTKHKHHMCAFLSHFGFAVKRDLLCSRSAMAQVSNWYQTAFVISHNRIAFFFERKMLLSHEMRS